MEVDTDLLFYFYCCKMGLSEREYWSSPLKKVMKLLDIYQDEQSIIKAEADGMNYRSKYFTEPEDCQEVQEITSMKEIEGW